MKIKALRGFAIAGQHIETGDILDIVGEYDGIRTDGSVTVSAKTARFLISAKKAESYQEKSKAKPNS